ncbi:hypothetical protein [Mycolicibacterium llatzerense]|uniref:hypothetical protein n=1 Tax=Mycolicibacterium llatzerense TaxID=280871 RepID=UPI0021B51793|nr:hypothetical protein [Mycolicibacterium llatzerense]MCT7366350.1 hypothetical protein [Mycolicibacterium llatzerense]MCT7370908.1 hypothetical protein [Mycolicibacterium llatzerense]
MDLLADLVNGHGQWCLTIARECTRSQVHYSDLVHANGIFGSPLTPSPAELIQTQILRTGMASPGEPSTQHLGEAESIAIILYRTIDAIFLTDDLGAKTLAARHDIKVVTTWDLLRMACRVGKLAADVLAGYLRTLAANNRGHPPGVVPADPASITAWLQ